MNRHKYLGSHGRACTVCGLLERDAIHRNTETPASVADQQESQLIEYARRMRIRAEELESELAILKCEHPSLDGVGVDEVWVCMTCGLLVRTVAEMIDGVKFIDNVALNPGEVLAVLGRIALRGRS